MSDEISKILEERNKTHGDFGPQSTYAQTLKEMFRTGLRWDKLSCSQKEALELIATKLARILYGNPNHKDAWQDIAGYSELVARELK